LGSHDSTTDGTYTGNVKELDEIDAPGFHGHIIDTVGMGHGGSGTLGVDLDNALYHLGIKQIPKH
jgi:hypothetical protein